MWCDLTSLPSGIDGTIMSAPQKLKQDSRRVQNFHVVPRPYTCPFCISTQNFKYCTEQRAALEDASSKEGDSVSRSSGAVGPFDEMRSRKIPTRRLLDERKNKTRLRPRPENSYSCSSYSMFVKFCTSFHSSLTSAMSIEHHRQRLRHGA